MGDPETRCRATGRSGRTLLTALLAMLLVPLAAAAASPAPAPSLTTCAIPDAGRHGPRWDVVVYGTIAALDPVVDDTAAIQVTLAVRRSLGAVRLTEARFRAGPGGCLPLDPARFAVGDELVVGAFEHPGTDPDLTGDLLVWTRDGDRWVPDAYAPGIDARLPPELRAIRSWWAILDLSGDWRRSPPDPAPTPPASLRPVLLTVPLAVASGSLDCPSIGGCAYVLQVQGVGREPVTVQLEQAPDGALAAPGGSMEVAPGPSTATLDVWAVSDAVRNGTRTFGAILATCTARLDVPISSERVGITVSTTSEACAIVAGPAGATGMDGS